MPLSVHSQNRQVCLGSSSLYTLYSPLFISATTASHRNKRHSHCPQFLTTQWEHKLTVIMVHGDKAGKSSTQHFQEHRMGKLLGRKRGKQWGKVSPGKVLPDLRSLRMSKCWVCGKEVRRAVQTENQHGSRHMEVCKGMVLLGTGSHPLVAGTLGMKTDKGKKWWRWSQKERESHFRFLRFIWHLKKINLIRF